MKDHSFGSSDCFPSVCVKLAICDQVGMIDCTHKHAHTEDGLREKGAIIMTSVNTK